MTVFANDRSKISHFRGFTVRRNVGLHEIISPQKMTALDLCEGQSFFSQLKEHKEVPLIPSQTKT